MDQLINSKSIETESIEHELDAIEMYIDSLWDQLPWRRSASSSEQAEVFARYLLGLKERIGSLRERFYSVRDGDEDAWKDAGIEFWNSIDSLKEDAKNLLDRFPIAEGKRR